MISQKISLIVLPIFFFIPLQRELYENTFSLQNNFSFHCLLVHCFKISHLLFRFFFSWAYTQFCRCTKLLDTCYILDLSKFPPNSLVFLLKFLTKLSQLQATEKFLAILFCLSNGLEVDSPYFADLRSVRNEMNVTLRKSRFSKNLKVWTKH